MSEKRNSILKCKYIFYGIYELPDNIHSLNDLDNNPTIANWGIKWGVLHIYWKNGEETEIQPSISIDETNDCKYPSEQPVDYIFETKEDSDYEN